MRKTEVIKVRNNILWKEMDGQELCVSKRKEGIVCELMNQNLLKEI